MESEGTLLMQVLNFIDNGSKLVRIRSQQTISFICNNKIKLKKNIRNRKPRIEQARDLEKVLD